MRSVYIAPSDFAYLFRDCPRCWWLKTRRLAPFREPFPAVFGKIDLAMKGALGSAPELLSDAADAPETEPKWIGVLQSLGLPVTGVLSIEAVKSAPIEYPDLGVSLTINGKLDKAYTTPDGIAIIDFKTSDPKTHKLDYFRSQLHCYQHALEHPLRGTPLEVSHLAIVAFNPYEMVLGAPKEGRCQSAIKGVLTYHPIEIERSGFVEKSLRELAELAAQDEMPPGASNCSRCFAVAEVIQYMNSKKRVAA